MGGMPSVTRFSGTAGADAVCARPGTGRARASSSERVSRVIPSPQESRCTKVRRPLRAREPDRARSPGTARCRSFPRSHGGRKIGGRVTAYRYPDSHVFYRKLGRSYPSIVRGGGGWLCDDKDKVYLGVEESSGG